MQSLRLQYFRYLELLLEEVLLSLTFQNKSKSVDFAASDFEGPIYSVQQVGALQLDLSIGQESEMWVL